MPSRRVTVIVIIVLTFAFSIVGWITISTSDRARDTNNRSRHEAEVKAESSDSRKLAIIVPVHQGDQDLAIQSLQQWPSKCNPLTRKNVDLIIYKAESMANEIDLLVWIGDGPARCFRKILMVSGNLLPEENVYPKGPSVQFYKLFLDPIVKEHFIKYDALAIIEWDVIVAHDSSFERLYKSAFMTSEPFWIKGCILAGSEFFGTASLPDKWHILGHINGNTIYNNTDPAFVEFVNYTFSRWGFTYSYDVALWATISDFPYSWPLWQRYSANFVTTNLIRNVGFRNVSHFDVLSAIEVDTLFIHGNTKSLGSVSSRVTELSKRHETFSGCTAACSSHDGIQGPLGSFTICDATCIDHKHHAGPTFERSGCGAGNPSIYGPACRLCVDEDRGTNSVSNTNRPVSGAKCGGKGPLESTDCSMECRESVDTICDARCGNGLYGNFHCNWRGLGKTCRYCFRDEFTARLGDKVAMMMGGRVVMCSTHEPPLLEINKTFPVTSENEKIARYLKPRSTGTKRSLLVKSSKEGVQENQSWQIYPSGAEFISNITRGQICVFIPGYPELHLVTEVSVRSINLFMPGVRVVVATKPAFINVYKRRKFWASKVMYRGSAAEFLVVLCKPGNNPTADATEDPLLTRNHDNGVDDGLFPTTIDKVSSFGECAKMKSETGVVNTSHVGFAAVEADMACGGETQLILYMRPGELLSRSFTSKDTHSPRGDLLVMYTDIGQISEASTKRSMASVSMLGFNSPLFTSGTDLILPVTANKHLRAKLIAVGSAKIIEGTKNKDMYSFQLIIKTLKSISEDIQDYGSIYIPEVLAAVAFLDNLDGVKFVNLQRWNHRHIFRDISIWDIPLIKPRFGCMIYSRDRLKQNIKNELNNWLAAFSHGARCERGFIAQIPETLASN